MLTNIIEEISLSNFEKLQNKINLIDPNFFISTINLYNWKYYNIRVFFKIEEDAIYLYSFYDGAKELYIFRPIIKKNEIKDIRFFYKKAILNIELRVKEYDKLHFITWNESDVFLFKNPKIFDTFNVSYLYNTDALKLMNGKKMQKKRNYVNYFNNHYLKNSQIVKYEDKYFNDVIQFCITQSIDEQNKVRWNEIDGIKEILKMNLKNGNGSILFYQDKIIGFTYGIINLDKYEIFIEKANDEFKGSYQYLLSNNLKLNNINTKFIDRQDDMNNPSLEKSKKSYNPLKIIVLYFFEINNIK